jgi:hypothetical protein
VTRRDWLYSTLLAVPLARPGLAAAQSGSRRLSLTRPEMEEFLRTAELTAIRSLPTGITNSRRATFTDGSARHDAHVQTVDEREPIHRTTDGMYMDFADSYKHNIAAYRLDQMLGLGMTPVSIERRVGGRRAAVTWWVDDLLMTEKDRYTKGIEAPDLERWNRQIYCVRVFDELIFNIDRNLGNLLITQDWTVWMIDHTRAFRPEKRLKDKNNLVRCDRLLLTALKGLSEGALRSELGEYLGDSRLGGLVARRDRIVEFFEEEVRQRGEAGVLFDYLPRPGAIEIQVAD